MKKITLFVFLWSFCISVINITAQYNQTVINNARDGDIFYHTVERGQTVYSIAKMYNVKVEDIYRLNPGSEEVIKAEDKLKIPQKTIVSKEETGTSDADEYIFHTVLPRETLFGLSRKYNVDWENIIEANPGISELTLPAGKTIRIPVGLKRKTTAEIVENNKGEKEVYYTIPAGDTWYSICRKFRTTEKELLNLNPELAGGLRKGITIRIPLRINEEDLPEDIEEDVSKVNALLAKKQVTKPEKEIKVAIILPFNSESLNRTKQQQLILEYYEGMLLALDTLRNQGYSIDPLTVLDIGDGSASKTKKQLQDNKEMLKNVNLIIGGASNEQIQLISDFAKENKIKYVIPFQTSNENVLDNSYIFQVHTPQTYLNANIAYAGANLFGKHNIIFIDTKDDKKHDQTDFIKEFKQELKYRNMSYKDMDYNAETFEEMILSRLSTSKPNMIMPISDTIEALIKIKDVLRSIAETKPEYELTLFGYPIWQRQDYYLNCLEDFHILNTYIYSRFYADNINPEVKTFYDYYKYWFSKTPIITYPKYSILGYDTGMFFFKSLYDYGANFESEISDINYKSLQTGFRFERVNNWGGFINTNIYIIHYGKDNTITRTEFK